MGNFLKWKEFMNFLDDLGNLLNKAEVSMKLSRFARPDGTNEAEMHIAKQRDMFVKLALETAGIINEQIAAASSCKFQVCSKCDEVDCPIKRNKFIAD